MEITCPECQYSRNIPDEKVPSTSVNATCPMCGTKFRFREIGPELAEELARRTGDAAGSAESPEARPAEADATPDAASEADATGAAPEASAAEPPQTPQPSETPEPPQAPPREDDEPAPKDRSPLEGDIWQRLDDLGDSHPGRGTRADGPPHGTADAEVDVPFERLDQYGFFGGLLETCRRSIVAPRLFFETMPVDRGYGRPIIFYVLLNILGVMLQLVLEFALHGMPTPDASQLPAGAAELSAGAGVVGAFLFVIVAGPAILTFFLYGISAILHVLLTLLQGVSGGFQATVRAVSYSAVPALLMAVPVVGMYIGSVWSIVLLTYALRGVHRTSYFKSGLAVMLYTLAGVALIMFAAGSLGMPQAGM